MLKSLAGKTVVFTGYLYPDGHRTTRSQATRLARELGAHVSRNSRAKVSASTDVLVRGDNPNYKFGDYGADDAEVERLQRLGYRIVLIDDEGFGALLAGG